MCDANENSTLGNKVVLRKKSTGGIRRRLIDSEGYICRADCVCVNTDCSRVLLISSKKDGTKWSIPGGGIEQHESEDEAAVREAWEEAGVRGNLQGTLGEFKTSHTSGLKKHRTRVYILRVTEEQSEFPEAYLGRQKQWFTKDEALKILSKKKPTQCSYLHFLFNPSSSSIIAE